jgi:hypothetical protein
MGDKVERVSVSDIETLGALCDAQKSTGTKLGTDLAYDQMVAALDELLAYREGYDPAERLPDGGKVVLIHYEYPHSDLLETATYDPVLERWNVILFTGTAVAETDEIDRWYPAPGGA